jgi:tryptophanyl-tRNA synthetase
MKQRTVLTGITTTGTPHLGNYVGAIKPCIQASHDEDVQSYYFLADYHALVKNQDPERMQRSSLEIAATWLALGLDTEHAVFYRQSDIPEILELTWILTCATAKGLMNRAHAYKAAVQENVDAGEDPDFAITMGLFSYPVLMAADILMFNSTHVPVGRDQVQHLEMARDIAQRFNHHYGELFVLPEAVVDEHVAVLPGKDGRKMSKSYNNTIPLWLTEKQLRKAIMRIVTNSLEPGEPKDPDDSALFAIHAAFASREQREARLGRCKAADFRTHQPGAAAGPRAVRGPDRRTGADRGDPARGRCQGPRLGDAFPGADSRSSGHPRTVMITVLLLSPVTVVLAWIYRQLLPAGQRWTVFDSALIVVALALASGWIAWANSGPADGAGPVWPDLLATAGAYPIIAGCLGLGLAWRRLRDVRERAVEPRR